MRNMTKLFGIIALAALTVFSMAVCGSRMDETVDPGGNGGGFVPVRNITGVNTTVVVGTSYLGGTVVPDDATNKSIVWTILSWEDTEGTLSGSRLTTKLEGTVMVRATIVDGIAEGKDYVKNFSIVVNPYVAVMRIDDVPRTSKVGELILEGNIKPEDASYTAVVWSIKDAGTTRATLRRDVLTTRDEGIIILIATIANGTAEGTDYTDDFSITITNEKP